MKTFRQLADYRPRIADKVLKDNLEAAGLVLIEGTKWCGKTTTAEQQSASVIYLTWLEDVLGRIPTETKIESLLPCNWSATKG